MSRFLRGTTVATDKGSRKSAQPLLSPRWKARADNHGMKNDSIADRERGKERKSESACLNHAWRAAFLFFFFFSPSFPLAYR